MPKKLKRMEMFCGVVGLVVERNGVERYYEPSRSSYKRAYKVLQSNRKRVKPVFDSVVAFELVF